MFLIFTNEVLAYGGCWLFNNQDLTMSFCAKLSPSSKILTNWSARNHRQGPMGNGQRMVVTTNLWTCWIPLQPPSGGGNVLHNVIERETRLKSGPK